MAERADVVVVGMGPGGEEVAGSLAEAGLAEAGLAEAGLDVVGIESTLVGGECPYWGCVPSKMMIRAADALAEGRRVGELAGTAKVTADWAPVARRIRDEATDDWDDKVAVERFEGKRRTVRPGPGDSHRPAHCGRGRFRDHRYRNPGVDSSDRRARLGAILD